MKLLFLFSLIFISNLWANPCLNDQQKFCPEIDPGKGQIMKCLDEHQGSLSSQCQSEVKKFKTKVMKENPCFMDLAQWCSEVPTIEEKIQVCLLKNESKLSSICAKDFKSKKDKIIKINPCAEDTVSFCYDKINLEEGFVGRCLIKNVLKLKPNCQVSIKKQIADHKLKNPCFDDTEKYCPDMVRRFDIDQCLTKKIATLTPACKKRIEEDQKISKINPCHQDIKRACKPGLNPAELNRCLIVNEKSLSSGCLKMRKELEEKMSLRVKNCEADRIKFCKDVEAKEGKILKCLMNKKDSLSPACKKVL